jgi:hypothetical protein
MSLSPKPTLPTLLQGNRTHPSYDQWFNSIQTWLGPQGQTGATTVRPTAGLYVGLAYFDATLGYPVFVSAVGPPVVWVNASGTPV